ncbi:MAG: peptidylprolyl isomerase, partial [Acidobacteriota bacterium]
MVVSLVFWGRNSTGGDLGVDLAHSQETAAKVAGEKITVAEIIRQKEQYSQFSRGNSFPAAMLINGLISSRILRVEAARLGLMASDAEVAAAIREQVKNPDGTPFDQKKYEENVGAQFGSVAAYEDSVRDDISAKKLQAFLTSGVTVSEEEVLKDFQRKNSKFDLSYVAVNTTDLAKAITPTDAELKDYFDKNKAAYYISVPQKKIKYLFINTAKIGEKLPISDADLQAEFEKIPADKKSAGALGQEIVLRVPKPDQDGKVQEKASTIVQDLKKNGEIVSEEAFATAAKGQSENPASALNGGKLSGPVRENSAKPDDPYQRLLKMKPGEVTEPIGYQNRYFILRRGEDVPKTFEMAKKELEVSLRNRRAYGVAAELAQKAADELKQNKDLQKTANDFASLANESVADMIRETAYVKPGDDVPNIGVSPDFEASIALLENQTDVGEKTPIQNGFAIPQLADKKEPRDAEFDEVKAQIVEIVKLDKAKAEIEQIANQIASGSANAGALAAAAQTKGLKAEDQKSFVLGSPLGQGPSATTSDALENAVYALKDGEVTKTPIHAGDTYYIIGLNKREDAKLDDFAKQRDDLMEQMLSQRRNAVFSDYLSSTKQKMDTAGQIVIYKDVLDKIDGPKGGLPGGAPSGDDN